MQFDPAAAFRGNEILAGSDRALPWDLSRPEENPTDAGLRQRDRRTLWKDNNL
jgi:hypothetical protein